MDEPMLMIPLSLAQKIADFVRHASSPLPGEWTFEILDGLRKLQPIVVQRPAPAAPPKPEGDE